MLGVELRLGRKGLARRVSLGTAPFTTPPCTKSPYWNLLKAHEKVDTRQLDKLNVVLGATLSGIDFNNIVPQPLKPPGRGRDVKRGSSQPDKQHSPPMVEDQWLYAETGHTEAHSASQ